MIPTLTFDDGPSEWTSAILDLLDEYDAKAAFFVIGANLELREDIVARADQAGHLIGNHSYNHPKLSVLSTTEIRNELADTNEQIKAILGRYPRVWRAPFFATNDLANDVAAELDLLHVGANVVPNDWMRTDPGEIAERVTDWIKFPGSIVSLHDGIPPNGGSDQCTDSRQPTVDALRVILEATR